jgi:vacuolar-type H+-ATPase subunit I/STV1
MFVKSDIRKVTIALEKASSHEVYMRLGAAGIIHLARFQSGDALADEGIAAEEITTREILAGSAFALNALQIDAGGEFVPERARSAKLDAAFVSGAKRSLERLQQLQKRLQEEADAVSERLEYAGALARMGIDPGAIRDSRLVRTVFGLTAGEVPDPPPGEQFVLARAGAYIVGTALPPAAQRMIEFLGRYGFEDRTDRVGAAPLERQRERHSALKGRSGILEKYADRFREEKGRALADIYLSYKGYEEVLKAMRMAASSAKAVFITGWMDARDKNRLTAILRDVCGERFIVSCERDPHAPVRLMNARLLRPFELIVRTMGMPANTEIDPTPLAAVTFVLVFGLMFGDLGQGLVLAMTGLVLKFFAKKGGREDLNQAGGILFACGLSAAVCGVLYGSLFSNEHLIPALWLRPSENIMRLFYATILMGAAVIVVGLFVNIVNNLINADYQEALLEKKGAAVFVLYGAVVLMAVRYVNSRQAPAAWEIGAFVIAPLLVFVLRGLIGPVLFKSARPHDIAEYAVETVMEVVEIALSMFANTISFIRVGAFALSHAGLSIVTYTLAGMAGPGLESPGAIAVVIAGNIFIIGFEGLIVGIQSMRLEYYEFFSKFYRGDGVQFSPFVLKTKMSEV